MPIQSILMSRYHFSLDTAFDWIVRHGFKHYKIDITRNNFRFRQQRPDPNKNYFTFRITDGVKAICFKT
jgi:hypothetical protein